MIAEKENVKVSSEAFQAILDTSEGDLRRAITTLQSAAKLRNGIESERGTYLNVINVINVIIVTKLASELVCNQF